VNPPRKSDASIIIDKLRSLRREPWLGPLQRSWPKYLFRFEDIESAARILNDGRLLSRAKAQANAVMAKDCASPEVLAQTDDRWKSYVRLYFRPRTPMQYDIEGFRYKSAYKLGGCCPVPVVFMFDSEDILTRTGAMFSNGNLAAKDPEWGEDASFFLTIPFDRVYHDNALDQAQPAKLRKTIYHRHAETIVPGELDLGALKYIVCRSQAEYETLLFLLDEKVRERWSEKIGPGTKGNLHFRHWTFVEQAELSSGAIHLHFNPSTGSVGPFNAVMNIVESAAGTRYKWQDSSYFIDVQDPVLKVGLGSLSHPVSYIVKLRLDEHLAYANRFEEYDSPF